MAKAKQNNSTGSSRPMRPAISPEANESQMISLAMDLVRQRLIDGTASSQETTHFLKLGTEKAQLEKIKLQRETEMIAAKAESIKKQETSDELYKQALKAFASYSGKDEPVDDY